MTALPVLILGLAIGSAAGIPKAAESETRPSHQQAVPQRAHVPYQYQETWYEFVLRQFNPDDVDFGRWIERERRAFIDARIRNPYFMYGVCTSLGLLLAAVVYMKLWIDHRRAMWITAEIMADIYNQDAYFAPGRRGGQSRSTTPTLNVATVQLRQRNMVVLLPLRALRSSS